MSSTCVPHDFFPIHKIPQDSTWFHMNFDPIHKIPQDSTWFHMNFDTIHKVPHDSTWILARSTRFHKIPHDSTWIVLACWYSFFLEFSPLSHVIIFVFISYRVILFPKTPLGTIHVESCGIMWNLVDRVKIHVESCGTHVERMWNSCWSSGTF